MQHQSLVFHFDLFVFVVYHVGFYPSYDPTL